MINTERNNLPLPDVAWKTWLLKAVFKDQRIIFFLLLMSHLLTQCLFSVQWLFWLMARKKTGDDGISHSQEANSLTERSKTTGKYQEVWMENNPDKGGIFTSLCSVFSETHSLCETWIKLSAEGWMRSGKMLLLHICCYSWGLLAKFRCEVAHW